MSLVTCFTALVAFVAILTIANLVLQPGMLVRLTPMRIFLSLCLPTFIVHSAKRRRSLSTSGAICAWFVGFLLTAFSYIHMGLMLVFFFTSSKLSKFRASRKKQIVSHFEKDIQRTWQQVVANGGVAILFSLISILTYEISSERPLDLSNPYSPTWYDLAIMGSLACANGDTWASEVGSAIGTSRPLLIFPMRRVPAGTNGAVSLIGLLASLAGGLVIGLSHYLFIFIFCSSYAVSRSSTYQANVILLGALSGFFGSLFDSFLGATVQYSGINKKTKKVVNEPGDNIDRISGYNLLNNNSVNLLASMFSALFCTFIAFNWLK